jgi:putative two-component system response regulator
MNAILKVLVVEDNPADVDLIRETLSSTRPAAFEIESVSRLSEALSRLTKSGIDLVLLDLGLPDSQGLGTLHKLREAASDIPTIVLTGSNDEDMAVAAVREGAQDYLVKGQIVGNALVRAARYAIERKRTEVQLRESVEQLRRAVQTTIQVLVMAVEIKDPYTAGHQRRMTNLARTMATEMGLPPEKIEGLRMAGIIHDIGKITLPTEILSKPTKLSAIELSLIREHVRLGHDILKDVESPWPMAEIVLQHHERMDGSGYPRGLKGEEILIEARILAVADVVEAIASHRPYRPALGVDAALKEIENNRGILYDTDVVDVCLKLLREKDYQLK